MHWTSCDIDFIVCNLKLLFIMLQRWPTVQDLAAATLEVMT